MAGQVAGQGLTFTTPELGDEHNGAKVQAIVVYNGAHLSNEATLTVTPDTTAPAVIALDGSRFMNSLKLVYSEALDDGEFGSYTVAGLSVDSADLLDSNTVILSTGDQTPGEVYTVSVSDV